MKKHKPVRLHDRYTPGEVWTSQKWKSQIHEDDLNGDNTQVGDAIKYLEEALRTPVKILYLKLSRP